jgi:hypothetical protein
MEVWYFVCEKDICLRGSKVEFYGFIYGLSPPMYSPKITLLRGGVAFQRHLRCEGSAFLSGVMSYSRTGYVLLILY